MTDTNGGAVKADGRDHVRGGRAIAADQGFAELRPIAGKAARQWNVVADHRRYAAHELAAVDIQSVG